MGQRLLSELLVDLKGVDPALVAAFIEALKHQASEPSTARPPLTFAELWASYEPWGRENIGSWRNVHAIQGRRHLIPFWGALAWPDCGFSRADEYVKKRRGEKSANGGRPIANATINRELATVKALFNWALRRPELGVKHNPIARYEDLPETSDRRFHLTEADFVKLLEHARPLLRLMLILAFETGMRRDEFRLLQWQEVNLPVGIIALPAHRTKARRARDVPLSDLAIQVLNQAKIPGSPWVFPSPNGTPPKAVPKSTLGQWFVAARESAGVKGPRQQEVWVHTLRKSSVTLKAIAGMDLQMNMDMHGHTSKEVHDEYRHLTPEYLEQARLALNRRRGPRPAEPRPTPTDEAAIEDSPLIRFVSATTKA